MRTLTDAAHRWSVFSRFVAATAGGYLLVTLVQLALTALSGDDHRTLLFSLQTGYLWYTGIIIWCFAARTAKRAWLGLGVVALPFALIAGWYLLQRGLP